MTEPASCRERHSGSRKAPVSSYEVFQKYVKQGKLSSRVDVSGIFSQECFLEWISTRPTRTIKFPPQSYQRVLYAHIRGVDKRRPFHQQVERELLRLLRDVKNNPWKKLFKNEKINFGKRGFVQKGYHEGMRFEADIRKIDEQSHFVGAHKFVVDDIISEKAEREKLINIRSLPQNQSFQEAEASASESSECESQSLNSPNHKNKFSHSYDVFVRYIRFDEESNKVDISRVFSKDCFQEWISTRLTKKVKFPFQSFQRVLYAHIRGADKRRPFTKQVEEQFLKVLRDLKHNPWQDVFDDEKSKMGKRKFFSKGFHEKKQKMSKMCKSTEEAKRKKTPTNPKKTKFPRFESTTIDPFQINSCFHLTFRSRTGAKVVPWDEMATTIQQYIPVEVQKLWVAKLNQRRVNFWNPSVFYFLNEPVNSSDFRFSNEFIFPSTEAQAFRTDRSTAQIDLSFTSTIIAQDNNATHLFREQLVGKHLFELYGSFVSLCYSFIRHIPALSETGNIWRRDILKKADGNLMVCLMYMVNTGTEFRLCIQDQTDLFPEIMKKVSFF